MKIPQAPPEGVKVWIDGDEYTAYADVPVNCTVKAGQHTTEVEGDFVKEDRPGRYYVYIFDYWSDGSIDNPRTDNITTDTTLTAYYRRLPYGWERPDI